MHLSHKAPTSPFVTCLSAALPVTPFFLFLLARRNGSFTSNTRTHTHTCTSLWTLLLKMEKLSAFFTQTSRLSKLVVLSLDTEWKVVFSDLKDGLDLPNKEEDLALMAALVIKKCIWVYVHRGLGKCCIACRSQSETRHAKSTGGFSNNYLHPGLKCDGGNPAYMR